MKLMPYNQWGFYQPDLEIIYIECNNTIIPTNFSESKKQFFQILYVISGTFEVDTKTNKFNAEQGSMIISKYNHSFKYRRTTVKSQCLTIHFHDNIFKDNGELDFLRAFNYSPSGSCLSPATFESLVCFELMNSFVKSLIDKRNRFYMLVKLQAVITELDFKYDDDSKNEKHDKNNVTLSVIEFVRNNFTQNITLKTIQDKFFICNSTINRMFKQATGMTFKKYLNQLRLTNANSLLKDNSYINASKISEMCGFKTYSTFYREYVSKFGIAPTKTTPKISKDSWPFKH